jgi:hypothetical protein
MDSTCADIYLLRVPVCGHAADSLQHREGWIREERSAHFDWKLIRLLRTADKLLSLFAAFKAL